MWAGLSSSGTSLIFELGTHSYANSQKLFYNVPPNDPLYQGLDFFAHISEPIKDALGVAWCTGSGYVVRRRALNTIGQIPEGSVAEDVLCSTLLLGRGWRTAYIHEGLQYGQVPGDYGSHIKQRTRWVTMLRSYRPYVLC